MFASLRAGRATFWYLAADRLVAAVIARTADEPLLEACAASYAHGGPSSLFAPGVVELAWLLGADRFGHVAALAAPFCSIDQVAETRSRRGTGAASQLAEAMVADGTDGFGALGGAVAAAGAAPTAGERVARIRGASVSSSGSGLRVRAQLRAVSQAQGLFRRARLRLLALDCEACALVTLADTLGTSAPGLVPVSASLSPGSPAQSSSLQSYPAQSCSLQPLAAVSVSPDAERAAHALGDDLAVPVGLALAWFGARRAR